MHVLKCSTLSLAVLFIVGCSPGREPDPPAPPPPAKTIFDPMTQQLNRARDVQKTVDQNAAATRKAVDAEEHGETP